MGICSYFVLIMPQPNRKHVYLLSQAEKNSRYAAIWCRYCKKRRYFLLAELREVFGDVDCDGLVDHRNWHCTQCNGTGRVDLTIGDPPAAGAIVRRLKGIKVIRQPIWQDEPY